MQFPELSEYLEMTAKERLSICRHIERAGVFQFIEQGKDDDLLPTFEHKSTSLQVKLVFGGTYQMGLSEEEEAAAKSLREPVPMDLGRMRPLHEVTIEPFFVTRYPLLPKQLQQITKFPYVDPTVPRGIPVRCTFDEAQTWAQRLGGRLPCESEWEYFCRGTTTSLFFFGNRLPDGQELEHLVRNDFDSDITFRHNHFGLFGLFSGEWCSDEYRSTYRRDATLDSTMRVGRGGASQLWPWQGDDWVWCVSANRAALPVDSGPKEKTIRSIFARLASKNAFRIVWSCAGSGQ